MNFDTLGVHLGTFRVAQKCQKGLKVPLFSQKCLGRIFGLLFEKIGLLFDQTVWSHWFAASTTYLNVRYQLSFVIGSSQRSLDNCYWLYRPNPWFPRSYADPLIIFKVNHHFHLLVEAETDSDHSNYRVTVQGCPA